MKHKINEIINFDLSNLLNKYHNANNKRSASGRICHFYIPEKPGIIALLLNAK